MDKCSNCGGVDLSWFPHMRNLSDVVDGRLCMREVTCVFVLGCNECAETIRVITADEAAHALSQRVVPKKVGK